MVRGMTRPAAARTAAVASTGAAFTLLPFGRSGSVNALSGRGRPKRLPCRTEREGHNRVMGGNLSAGRAQGETRIVPVHPELAKILRAPIDQFGTGPDGRLFTGVRGGNSPRSPPGGRGPPPGSRR